jgi:hypothetical protein
MPYIVITERPSQPDAGNSAQRNRSVSRRAVATLEEARREAGRACLGSTSLDLRNVEQARTLPESGGTVGPLPDGTVIEVRPA